jgi:chaperonin GroEL
MSDDFQELITGLGFQFCRNVIERKGSSYSDKKINRFSQLKGYKYGAKIVNISRTGIFTEMMCIKVSNENHLYITDGYIPTHNTTTAIVLTEALVMSGVKYLTPGINRTEVLRELVSETTSIIDTLYSVATPVDDRKLLDVAVISANNDPAIGSLIAEVYQKLGKDGIVTVEKSQSSETYVETTDGIKVDRGYSSHLFINNHKKDECILEDVLVLVCDSEINNILSIENVLRPIINEGKKLLVIAPCSNNVINTFAANVLKNNLKLCVIQPPSFGYKQHELMSDIAIAVGAKYYSEKTGDDLSLISVADLGHADKVIIGRSETIIIKDEETKEGVDERVAQLWEAHSIADKKIDKDFITSRIASLTGGIGVIYVGGNTDLEQKELYDRVDDAVCAVRSAMIDGVLPGAGTALMWIADKYTGRERPVDKIIAEALRAPAAQILANAGIAFESIYPSDALHPFGWGYDLKGERHGELMALGVIDPMKVTKSALQNAVSVAVTILSTNAIITNEA